MLKPATMAILGSFALAALGPAPAQAGGWCDCGYGYYGAYAYGPPVVYTYRPRVAYYSIRALHPRWQYAAAYYNPPVYGYGYVSRGPAVLIHRHGHRHRHWHRRW
jgi:hypothetical protein